MTGSEVFMAFGWPAMLFTLFVVAVVAIQAVMKIQDTNGLKYREGLCDDWARVLGVSTRSPEESLNQYEDRLMRKVRREDML
jgi:hypothetical protein